MLTALLALVVALAIQDEARPSGGIVRFVPPSPAPGFIADLPRVLEAPVRDRLDARIRSLQAEGFGDIAVAVLPSVGDYGPSDVGVAIYRSWRVGRIDTLGSSRRNLGVLLLIVPKELAPDGVGHCWITTGRGAEGVVTDAASGRICREAVIPHLRERNYAAAVSAGIDALEARLRSDEGLATEPAGRPLAPGARAAGPDDGGGFRWWYVPAGLLALGGGTAGALAWRRRRPRRCPRCGRTMERLSDADDDAELEHGARVEERVKSVDYDVWRCACGETLTLPYRRPFTSYRKCERCGRRTVKTTRRTIEAASYASSGRAEDTHRCEACGEERVEQVILPKLTPPSSSGSSSGGGGSRSGGGSRGGFGGSGSTGGGGGGGRY